MEPTCVTVHLTAKDYGAFVGFALRSPLRRLQLIFGGGALLWLCGAWARNPQRSTPVYLEIAAVVVLGLLLLPKVLNAFFGWLMARQQVRIGSTDYEIRDEGLYFKNHVEEGVRGWSSFQRAARKGAASYLFVNQLSGFIFPDHCFATREDAVHFFEQLLEHLKGAGKPMNWQASRPPRLEPLEPAAVTVQLEPEDLRRFNRFLPGAWWRRLTFWAFIAIFVAGMFFVPSQIPSDRLISAPGAAPDPVFVFFIHYGVPLMVLIFFGFSFWRASRPSHYRKQFPNLFVPMTYTVSDEGLLGKSENGEFVTDWRAVFQFAETDGYFYVLLAKRRGMVLPKRCFPSKEAAAIFANQVRLHLEKHARNALSPTPAP